MGRWSVARSRLIPATLWLTLAAVTQPALGQTSLAGLVRDSAGRPIAGAEVGIEALSRITHTDDAGHYVLAGIAPGMRVVRVRRVGWVAFSRTVQVAPGDNALGDIVLTAVVVVLDTVTTKDQARARNALVAGFIERKRTTPRGYFRDSTTLGKNNELGGMFADMPSVVFFTPPGGGIHLRMWSTAFGTSLSSASPHQCLASVWVDRVRQPTVTSARAVYQADTLSILTTLRPSDIAAMEVYLSSDETPAEFGGGAIAKPEGPPPCGTIVIWTKRGWP